MSSQLGTLYQKQSTTGLYSGPVVETIVTSPPEYVFYQLDSNSTLGLKTTTAFATDDAGVPDVQRLHVSWDGSTAAVQVGTSPPVTGTFTSTGLGAAGALGYIGCNPPGGGFKICYTGDIAELVGVAGATINPTDVQKLESYLDTKYGL